MSERFTRSRYPVGACIHHQSDSLVRPRSTGLLEDPARGLPRLPRGADQSHRAARCRAYLLAVDGLSERPAIATRA
jgi:hypothetical protein